MIKALIRWFAKDELSEMQAQILAANDVAKAAEAAINCAYANGFNAGRAIGHGEMLTHLRGDPDERATTEIMQRRAVEMVH